MTASRLVDINLSDLRIGLSGAVPDQVEWGNRALDWEILSFVSTLADAVFRYGGRLVHGCHPSFTPRILGLAEPYKGTRSSPLVTFVMSDLWSNEHLGRQISQERYQGLVELIEVNRVVPPGADGDSANDPLVRNASLVAMRQRLIAEMDVLVVIGGKRWTGTALRPGTLEELELALARKIPTFLLGGFGGMAEELAQRAVAEGNSHEHFAHGLDSETSRYLLSTANAAMASALIINTCHRLQNEATMSTSPRRSMSRRRSLLRIEDNWECLISKIRAGTVIPVIGPDLLDVNTARPGEPARFQKLDSLVADDLRCSYQLPARRQRATKWRLHEYVVWLMESRRIAADDIRVKLFKSIKRTIDTAVPEALRRLASVRDFKLYVSLTCDDMLFKALLEADANAKSFAFSCNGSSNSTGVDIPLRPAGKMSYRLFGSADACPLDYAIHEGDAYEYLFKLQSEQAPRIPNLLGALRSSDLLFIGCQLPDWAGRTLLRLTSDTALESRRRLAFFAEPRADPALVAFLTRFSKYCLYFPCDARSFVDELVHRLDNGGPSTGKKPEVFVSYAGQDRNVAEAIGKRLLELGAGDVWIDYKKLVGGDDWSSRIDEAIADCSFFLPVLSAKADDSEGGYFWGEWRQAIQRSKRSILNDRIFLLPTLIDADSNAYKSYKKIGHNTASSHILDKCFLHAPGGTFSAKAEEDLADIFRRWYLKSP